MGLGIRKGYCPQNISRGDSLTDAYMHGIVNIPAFNIWGVLGGNLLLDQGVKEKSL
jgi:hypothetical protein